VLLRSAISLDAASRSEMRREAREALGGKRLRVDENKRDH
jgi:hypothetical protein